LLCPYVIFSVNRDHLHAAGLYAGRVTVIKIFLYRRGTVRGGIFCLQLTGRNRENKCGEVNEIAHGIFCFYKNNDFLLNPVCKSFSLHAK